MAWDRKWRRRILTIAILIPLALATALVFDKPLLHGWIEHVLGAEQYKLLLQFVLSTVLGGIVVWFFKESKEAQARRDLRVQTLQALDEDIAKVSRLITLTRRRLRSKLRNSLERVAAKNLEPCMDYVLDARSAVREIEDRVETRSLLDDRTAGFIAFLDYTAAYLLDVYRELDKRTCKADGDGLAVAETHNLQDFLKSTLPDELKEPIEQLKKGKSGDRQAAFKVIRDRRKSTDLKKRYYEVALACVRSGSSEVKDFIDLQMQ